MDTKTAAQLLGHLGGTARAKSLSAEKRKTIAYMGALARIKKMGQKRRKKAA